jgi:hypothetical protein
MFQMQIRTWLAFGNIQGLSGYDFIHIERLYKYYKSFQSYAVIKEFAVYLLSVLIEY